MILNIKKIELKMLQIGCMKTKFILLGLLLLFGCKSTKYIGYNVSSENYNTKERTYMKTIDINDAVYLYNALTGKDLDTTKINPYYDEKTLGYYFYVERKQLKRAW